MKALKIPLPFIHCGSHAECRYCGARLDIPQCDTYIEASLIDGQFRLAFLDCVDRRVLTSHGCSVSH